jgi:hypothetical protein
VEPIVTVTLGELGLTEDVGRAWHPRHPEAYGPDGELLDLEAGEAIRHLEKPEAVASREAVHSLAAEDSEWSPEGEI